MYNNQSIGAVARDVGAVQTEAVYVTTCLDQSISRLVERVAVLSQRLSPMLENRPQSEQTGKLTGSKPERSVYSPLAQGIIMDARRIEDIDNVISNLIETLAI